MNIPEPLLQTLREEFDQCIKCGLCLASCPVCKELLLEKYAPRGKIQLARHYAQGELQASDHLREIFARCLLCGGCSVTCPSGVDLTRVFAAMRALMAQERGVHPRMAPVVEALDSCHNISGEDNEERGEWRDLVKELPPHAFEKERAETVYFVGCVASFFPMVQGIPAALSRILEASGVDFAILGGREWCCGFPLIGAGEPGRLESLKRHNIEAVEALGASRVVFSCPSCYRVWKEHYPAGPELYHSTQLIEQLLEEGRLRPKSLPPLRITYHDPCDLGRHGGIFESPRQILSAIPGLELVEMENNRDRSTCCGGGGNLEMSDPELSGRVARQRIQEILATGARTVVTSCQQCVRTIKSRARRERVDLDVLDIAEVVARSFEA